MFSYLCLIYVGTNTDKDMKKNNLVSHIKWFKEQVTTLLISVEVKLNVIFCKAWFSTTGVG